MKRNGEYRLKIPFAILKMIIRIVQTSYSLGTSISIFITIETLNCILFKDDKLDSITI